MKVPLLDLKAQFDTIRDEVLPAVHEVVEAQRFIMGSQVAELEQAVAAACKTRFGIACASGTDALLLSLKTLNLEPGDEVVTSPFTFFATAGAITNAGGTIYDTDRLGVGGVSHERGREKVSRIYESMVRVFEIADRDKIPTYLAADRMAEERITEIAKVKKYVDDLRP